MGFLDRAIKRGVNRALGGAVENAVEKAVTPAVNKAVDSAANKINQAAGTRTTDAAYPEQPQSVDNAAVNQAAGTLGGLFGGLTGAATNFANEAAKNMKLCPSCGEPSGKDVKFCPKCGAKLPDSTVAESAVCPSCGKQNRIGTKFCADCGTKLPGAVAEEQASAARDAEVLAKWSELLPNYPAWRFGGRNYSLESGGSDGNYYYMFSASFNSNAEAKNAVHQYRLLLNENGFDTAGQYKSIYHLYAMIGGVCCHCDTKHCFDGNDFDMTIGFNTEEPSGGFDYVKPEPKKQPGFKEFFKF